MRCTKFEVTIFLGVGIFLIGAICLVALTVQKVFPAREEQSLKAINCTIASGNMNAKETCQHKKRDDSTYPCLRVYVLCGKDAKKNGSMARVQPLLLLKDFHSLQKQVGTNLSSLYSLCLRKVFVVKFGFFRGKICIWPVGEKFPFILFYFRVLIVQIFQI